MSDKEKSEKKVANPNKSATDNKQTKELKISSKEPLPVEDKVDKAKNKIDKAVKKIDKVEKKIDKVEKKIDKVEKAEKKDEKVKKEVEKTEKKNEMPENHSETPEVNPAKQLKKKKEIIRVLRELVNGVENKDTFNNVKDLQNAWKDIGYINNSKDKSLWTTYNALLDRFYDNRSIYFELKDLDRKKNLELKNAICEKAEKLVDNSNIMRAVSSLNELHAEFKHIGPVERNKQEDIWNR